MMAYESQLEIIWIKLSNEGSVRRPITSRIEFDTVVAAFIQAEHCPHSDPSSPEVDAFRAEWNIWTYFFGDAVQFPGRNPLTGRSLAGSSLDVNMTTEITSTEAAERKKHIQQLWAGRWNRKNYSPQLGWNPETGEPRMAVRSYAGNSYPALSGEQHSHLKHVQEQMPEFLLQYERFPHLGFTLIWPEFADLSNLKNQGTWRRFGQLRAFLAEWSSIIPQAPHINIALAYFLQTPDDQRPCLPLPPGFVLDAPTPGKLSPPANRHTVLSDRYRPRRRRQEERSRSWKEDMDRTMDRIRGLAIEEIDSDRDCRRDLSARPARDTYRPRRGGYQPRRGGYRPRRGNRRQHR